MCKRAFRSVYTETPTHRDSELLLYILPKWNPQKRNKRNFQMGLVKWNLGFVNVLNESVTHCFAELFAV